MAVPEQTPYIEYAANGVATSFALGFDCESKDHLIVTLDGVEPPVGDWLLTDGVVVFTAAPSNGVLVVIQRNTPFSRTTDYQSYNNSFRPPAVNKDFDWIWLKLQELGVADWILSNRIDALKNYVDDRDDELRTYLLEEIRKQGVALDQLDEYYNYLMERLAQIAVDKGWDASFVVDGDKTQKQINDDVLKQFKELATVKPLFVETLLSFGKYGIGAPSGVANYPGGNYVLTVSGNEGDSFVTVSSGNISHAGATTKWAAVIEYDDGSFGTYQVQGFAGSQLNIFPALEHSISNAKLGNIHDMVAGQHYTELGYKAFAQHIYNFNAKYALRDKFIAQFYGADTSSDWVSIGSPSLTYNRGLSPSGSDYLIKGDSNKSLTVKANAADEGVYWEVDLGKMQGYLELNVGLFEGTSATIEFYLDDILKETKIIGLTADRFIFEYANYSKGKILIKAPAGTTVRIGRTVWWSSIGKSKRLIPESAKKIAYLGDSWGAYHNAAAPNEILRLHKLVNPHATLVNKSQGGMTTKYGVAWIDWVLAQNPDVVIIEFFTNDNNCITGASSGINFTDPDGNTQNTFVTRADYFNNLAILANKCIDAGVQPIFIMPAVVESQVQTQYHAILARDVATGAASVPQKLKLQTLDATQSNVDYILTDKIETKTLLNTTLDIITSYYGAVVKPRVMRYGDGALFQVQNNNGTKLFEVIADELAGNKMPSLRLTGIFAEQGLKLVKTQIVDSVIGAYGGNVLRIKGQTPGSLKAIQIGENAAKVELLAPAIPFVATSLPTASSSNRGQTYLVQAGTGIADKLYICIKNASEGYEWKEL